MKNDVLQKVAEYGKAHRNRKRWFRIFACLAAVVVFCTTYALILPAITLERAHCEIPEHVHTEECYTKVASIAKTEPICTIASLKIHEHKEDCYNEEGRLICGYADFVVHKHDASCYDADGKLWCPLPEIEEHEHDDSCYTWDASVKTAKDSNAEKGLFLGKALKHVGKVTETGSGHVHNEDCYTLQRGGRICTETGDAGHIHDENCYTEKEVLVCDLEEEKGHEHDADCYDEDGELICDLEESEGHRHDDGCYEMEEALVCDLEEQEGSEHVHTDECYEWDEVLTCGLSEQSSEYSDSLEENEIVEDSDFEESGESVTDREPEEESIPTESESSSEESSEEETRQEESSEAETEEERAGEPVFICEKEEIILHEHTEDCFDEDGNLICGEIQVLEHVHTADCFHTVETACDPDELTCQIPESEGHMHGKECLDDNGELICQLEESSGHQHTALCYGTWELTCTLEEHTHSEACQPSADLTEEEQAKVERIIRMIEELPSGEEIEEKLMALEESGDEDAYEAYFTEVALKAKTTYAYYEDLEPRLQECVTNAEKLLELEWLWSAATMAITDTVTVYQINTYSQAVTTLVYGGSVGDKLGSGMSYTYWDAIVVEKDSTGRLYVSKYVTADGDKRVYQASTGDGFVLLLYKTSVNVEVGSEVTVDFNYKTLEGYNGNGHGTIMFGTAAALKPEKDNSDKLTIVRGADTRELIEVNLYDYNSSINTLYNSNKKYPGFQQEYGSINVGDEFKRFQSFNFGNNITSDLSAGLPGVTNSGGAINATTNGANSPISGAMLGRLGSDGQPALSDGTSLGYLFSNSAYASKKNSQSINGLF